MNDFRKRFWIRRDREQYFFIGVVLACAIGGPVTTWWHFLDKVAVERRVVMRKVPTITKLKEAQILKEDRLSPGGSRLLEIGRALEHEDAPASERRSVKKKALTPAGEKQSDK